METLTVDYSQAVATIRFTRQEVRNALSQKMRQELKEALESLQHLKEVRAVVFTGTGQAFCAGLDLSELKQVTQRSTLENRTDSEAFAALLDKIYTYPKPVIAALNGHAVAGGAGIVSVCDYAVMAQDAKLAYTEVRIGFVPAIVAVYLVRLLGEKHARDLLLSGRFIGADEAYRLGLVNKVCAADDVLKEALGYAKLLAKNAPSSLTITKTLLAALPGMGLQEGLRYAGEVNALARTTPDLLEGVGAFLEKRSPNWDKASS